MHVYPLGFFVAIRSHELRIPQYNDCFPLFFVLSGKLAFRHSMNLDSFFVRGLFRRQSCQVCITMLPSQPAGENILVERCWRCVQSLLFSCEASPMVSRTLMIFGLTSWIFCFLTPPLLPRPFFSQ
jgi:hypothetical protein